MANETYKINRTGKNIADLLDKIANIPGSYFAKYTVAIPAASWTAGTNTVTWADGTTSSYGYKATVSLAGVSSNDNLTLSERTRVTNDVKKIKAIVTRENAIDLYASEAISGTLTLYLIGTL